MIKYTRAMFWLAYLGTLLLFVGYFQQSVLLLGALAIFTFWVYAAACGAKRRKHVRP
jgi:hypothetical protein